MVELSLSAGLISTVKQIAFSSDDSILVALYTADNNLYLVCLHAADGSVSSNFEVAST
jgi:hypothetical protein